MKLRLVQSNMEEISHIATNTAAASAMASKAASGYSAAKTLAIATGAGGLFISILTMAKAKPKSDSEMFAALLSMFFCAGCGQAAAVIYFGIVLPDDINGLAARTGIAAICGAVGWLIVRGWFKWSEDSGVKNVADLLTKIVDMLKRK